MSFGCAEKDDGKVSGRRGSDGRQEDVVHDADGPFDHRFASAQWSVDIQAAEVLANCLQFLKKNNRKKL